MKKINETTAIKVYIMSGSKKDGGYTFQVKGPEGVEIKLTVEEDRFSRSNDGIFIYGNDKEGLVNVMTAMAKAILEHRTKAKI